MRPSSLALVVVVKLLVGAYARWVGVQPGSAQRIYFANHTSHIDTLAIWSALPRALRQRTRPIAARDYWGHGLKRYLATRVFGAVLIDRARENVQSDPLEPLRVALDAGDSLIIFPEGTRGTTAVPARFRGGLYRLASEYPQVELVPVHLDNLHRALPKGALLPIPMVCTVRFGAPLLLRMDESREDFLARARLAVMALAESVRPGMPESIHAMPELYPLFGGLVAVLALASLIGQFMSRRAREPASRDMIGNLNARINAWWVMVAVLAVTFLLGRNTTLVAFALMSYFALREFVTLTPTPAADRLPLSVAFFVIVPAQFVLIGLDQYGTFSIFVPVYAFLLLPAITAMRGEVEEFLPRTAKLQWGLMIAVFCLSHAPALLLLQIDGYGGRSALLLFFLLLVVQMSDVMQYVFGKLLGRKKIAPLVSPSKTVGGFIGGGLAATAIGAAMWWITPFTPLVAAAMAAAIVVMGFLGGLTLSAVKRSLGAKDWGVMIEGHGGMLDRLDSVCYAAPVFFHITRYFYT